VTAFLLPSSSTFTTPLFKLHLTHIDVTFWVADCLVRHFFELCLLAAGFAGISFLQVLLSRPLVAAAIGAQQPRRHSH
jgi:hypothetical protein